MTGRLNLTRGAWHWLFCLVFGCWTQTHANLRVLFGITCLDENLCQYCDLYRYTLLHTVSCKDFPWLHLHIPIFVSRTLGNIYSSWKLLKTPRSLGERIIYVINCSTWPRISPYTPSLSFSSASMFIFFYHGLSLIGKQWLWRNCLLVGRGIFINSQEKICLYMSWLSAIGLDTIMKRKWRVLAVLDKQYNYWKEKALTMWKIYLKKKIQKAREFFPNRKAVHFWIILVS